MRGRVEDTPPEAFERSLAVNFFGALYPVQALLPHLIRQRRGHLVFVNSLDAKKGIVGDGPYVAAKSALAGLADVLRQEVRPHGIHVASVFPGRVDTPMIETLRTPWIAPKIPPAAVARAVVRALTSRRATYVVPLPYAPLGALNDLFPRFMDWFYDRMGIEGTEAR